MQTLDLRDTSYDNDSTYYMTTDNDLVHKSDMTLSDEPKIKILVNGFYCGTLEHWENHILETALNFLGERVAA